MKKMYCPWHKGWQKKIDGRCEKCQQDAAGAAITWKSPGGGTYHAKVVRLTMNDVLISWGGKEQFLPADVQDQDIHIEGMWGETNIPLPTGATNDVS